MAAPVLGDDMKDRSTNFDQGLLFKTCQQLRHGNCLQVQVNPDKRTPRLNAKLAGPARIGIFCRNAQVAIAFELANKSFRSQLVVAGLTATDVVIGTSNLANQSGDGLLGVFRVEALVPMTGNHTLANVHLKPTPLLDPCGLEKLNITMRDQLLRSQGQQSTNCR